MRRSPPVWAIAAVAFGVGALASVGVWWMLSHGGESSQSAVATSEALAGLDAALVAAGREVYQAQCAACHGQDGVGERPDWRTPNPDGTYPAPPHDSSGHTWHHADGLLYRIVRDGGAMFETATFKSRMPAWGDRLTHEQIIAVVTYLKTLWGTEERAFQTEVSERDPFP